jgi:hypothetical protein
VFEFSSAPKFCYKNAFGAHEWGCPRPNLRSRSTKIFGVGAKVARVGML